MSELKARFIDDTYAEYFNTGKHDLAQVYIKTEVDKVIAELEESHKKEVGQLLIEIAELKNEIEKQKRLRDMALASVPNALKVMKIIQHHKYKRCLAMARWCDEVMMSCELRGCEVHRIWANKHQWAMRWKYKWLEIAEKFKPNNSTAQ